MAREHIEHETLAWYRPTIRGLVFKAWAQALGLVLLGASVLGLLRVERIDFGSPWLPVYALGMLLVMGGPLWLATRLSRVMGHERCLLLERDRLVWLEGELRVAEIPWDDIESVAVEGDTLVITSSDPAQPRLVLPARFEDIAPEALATTLLDLRRRSLMGLPMRLQASD